MPDEIIKELWEIKDRIAEEFDYDLDAFVDYLQTKEREKNQQVVDLRARKKTAQSDPISEPDRLCR